MKLAVTLVMFITALGSFVANAGSISLGQASQYNLFVKGNFESTGPDIEGTAAVGGNLMISGGYDFGYKAKPSDATLVVGGNITQTSQWNNSVKLFDGKGKVNEAGKLVYGGTITGNVSGNKVKGNPINFNDAFVHLNKLSAELASRTAAVSNPVHDVSNKTLTFRPSVKNNDNVYVFNLTQSQMNNLNRVVVDDSVIGTDALVVFNMLADQKCASGTKDCFTFNQNKTAFQIGNAASNQVDTLTGKSLMDQRTLFNFNGINKLDITSSVYGSILAPSAAINASGGVIWGQVIGESWKSTNTGGLGHTQINWAPLKPPSGSTPPAVSTPPAWSLLVLALAFLLYQNRRITLQQREPQLA
jgi:choice-of-anchor A domain-containing protein